MGSKDSFVHLHVHTDYSKLDGMETVTEVAQFAAKDEQPAIAITDHGNMSGYIKFEQACMKVGVKPIPGLEAYHVDSFENAKSRARDDKAKSRDHMLLLAVSDEGYRNLMQLSSRAYLEQFYYKPLVDDALLEQHTKGLVMTTGCVGSPINQAILRGDDDKARALLAMYRDMMEPGHFFAEVQVHDFPEQHKVNSVLLPMAKDMGIPLVATQDAHYSSSLRARVHEKMLAMQTGVSLSEKPISEGGKRFTFATHSNYLATAKQMREMVPNDEFPDACDNTLLIAEMASDITPQTGSKYLIPSFPDAEGDERSMLRKKVIAGAKERYGSTYSTEVSERIAYELDVIHDMGFDAYFLITWDFVKWAKEQGILVGPGRGSAAGSIVSYCLDITTIDPLKYGLYFERFLNPGRKSMPDIDIDFEKDRRGEVRAYLVEKYGSDHVAYIATQGRFHGRSAIKAAARIHEVPVTRANSLSTLFPKTTDLSIAQIAGPREDLDEGKREAWRDGEDFRKMVIKGGNEVAQVVDSAADVEGYIQNFGVHAAAVLITPKPLTNYVPLTNETSDKSLAVCGYDKDDVESIGGLKMDLLGLINLSTIKQCVEQIYQNTGERVDVNNLPLDDKKTFALLQRADTDGVFQLASSGMKELLRRLRPDRFEDISALVALYRPGPMGTDMHWQYADRKNGREKISVEHPDMMDILGETHGVLVYQEQLLALAQHYAGFTAGEADTLRKATGKKDAALLATQESKFKDGMARNGYPTSLANKLWAKIPSFAMYSFNKAHSAAYGMVSYQTAYLKANYPAEYAAACIDTLKDPAVQMQWGKAAGIVFDVPDVNESNMGARAFNGKVRLGLSGIKGLGAASCEAIVSERHAGGDFKSFSDFLVRVVAAKVNKTAVEALIEAGALDSLARSRGEMLRRLPSLLDEVRKALPTVSDDDDDWGETSLFDDDDVPELALRFDTEAPESMPLSDRVRKQIERLGVPLGVHPMTLFANHVGPRIPADSLEVSPSVPLGDVMVHGIITGIEQKQTRRSTMSTITIEASDGNSLDVKIFVDADDILEAGLGSLLVVNGTLQEDEWQKGQQQGGEEVIDGEEVAGDAPRELMADNWVVMPLSILDSFEDDDADHDHHNVCITVEDSGLLGSVAEALVGNLSEGLRSITIDTPDEVTVLPETVSETAEQIASMLEHLEGVSVDRVR